MRVRADRFVALGIVEDGSGEQHSHLPQTATAITRRLMGMILAAVAVEMMTASLRAMFPGLTR